MVSESNSERPEIEYRKASEKNETCSFPNTSTLGEFLLPKYSDATILLDCFPPELWKRILENAQKQNDPQDVVNLTHASVFFRDELLVHRVLFLFPLVYPDLQKYLISTEILKCREVSSFWNKAVLTSFTDHPSHKNISLTPTPISPLHSYLPHPPVFQYGRHIRDLINHFKGTHCDGVQTGLLDLFSSYAIVPMPRDDTNGELTTNPFPSRAVALSIPRGSAQPPEHLNLPGPPFSLRNFVDAMVEPEVIADAWKNGVEQAVATRPGQVSRAQWRTLGSQSSLLIGWDMENFLRIFGHHIFYCTVDSPLDKSTSSLNFCYYLGEWMALMRNLKVLRVNFNGRDVTKGRCKLSREETEFTKLDDLEFLQVNNLPKPCFKELLRVNSHIKRLKITGIHGDVGIFDMHLPNLIVLSISLGKGEDFLNLEEPETGAWKLEEFYLQIGDHEENSEFDQWSRIFTVIQEKWGTTLKRVQIQLPDSVNKTELNEMLQNNYTLMSITTIL